MTDREPDFEFDFFEEPETREAAGRDRTLRRPLGGSRGPRVPRGPIRPRAGFTPLLRLLGLIAFAILIVVLLLLWAQSCQENKKRDAYGNYMSDISAVGRESDRVGRELSDVLTTPGIKPAELQKQLAGLVTQQQTGITRAKALDPPGPLRASHEAALEALEFRADGLAGLSEGFRRTQGSKDAAAAGALLASQAERLVASDVVWDDLFKDRAVTVLQEQEVSGVEVPDSNFVQTPDLASTRSMVPIWERINGSAASGTGTTTGLHGTNIESVKVVPGGQVLSASTENTVEASTDLAFAVTVADSGDNQEVKIEVTLTIQQSPTPIVKKQTIDIINPGETKTVVFRDFPSVDFGERRIMRIDVDPVPGEENTGNNTAEYPVIFSLGA
ncbi:MAG TPA: CARDB domain-containing protein [Gaiellaceae bacterium]|nr:CARDB domain-containing protein [Gaiellaceae bacterium]